MVMRILSRRSLRNCATLLLQQMSDIGLLPLAPNGKIL